MSFSVERVDKDEPEWASICKLFHVTDPQNLGVGRDVKESGSYTGLTPVLAWKIDAPIRLAKYEAAMEEIQDAMSSAGLELPSVATKLDMAAEELFSDLDESAGEKVLLHGTKPDTLLTLLQNGLSERFSGGLFGNGSYLAEDPSKIDQYCTPDNNEDAKPDKLHTMLFDECDVKPFPGMFFALVVRVALGYPVFTKDGETNSSPPHNKVFANDTKRELSLIPECGELPVHYHSLIADVGSIKDGYKCARHREFVIFDSSRIMEKFVVGYLRDMAPINLAGAVEIEATDDPAMQAECGHQGLRQGAAAKPGLAPPVNRFPIDGIRDVAGIAISPCGTFALVGSSNDEETRLGRIDLNTGALSFPYSNLSGPATSVAISRNGNFALVTDTQNDQISMIDLLTGQSTVPYLADIDTPNQVAISPCGSFALAACEPSFIVKLDLSDPHSGAVASTFDDLDYAPQGIAISHDGSYALFSHEANGGGIARLKLQTGEVEDVVDTNRLGCCYHITIAPSGLFALIASSPSHGRLDLRTNDIAFVEDYKDDERITTISRPFGVSIAPSETYALLTCQDTNKIYCISNASKAWKPTANDEFSEEPKSKLCCTLL